MTIREDNEKKNKIQQIISYIESIQGKGIPYEEQYRTIEEMIE